MLRVAIQMLLGDRTKYITLVLGLAFASLLMNQQGAIFLGLLKQGTGPLQNIHQPDLWVMDPSTTWVAEYRSLSDQKLARIRSVAGVEWAEPFFNNWAVIELPDGTFKKVQILGVGRSTLVGRPAVITGGRVEDLRAPDAIIVEERSRAMVGNPKIGDTLKINDHRAVVVGFCEAARGFESNAMVYTTFDNAVRFTPVGRNAISYILVRAKAGVDVRRLQRDIAALGDLVAYTPDEFRLVSTRFIIIATGIGVNFGITISLGFLVGLFLSASVFLQFTLENLRYFAVLKALGARTPTLVGMVITQALIVGVIGYSIGVGLAGFFSIISKKLSSELSVLYPWQLMAISLAATLLVILGASLLSIRRVIAVEPARVFAS